MSNGSLEEAAAADPAARVWRLVDRPLGGTLLWIVSYSVWIDAAGRADASLGQVLRSAATSPDSWPEESAMLAGLMLRAPVDWAHTFSGQHSREAGRTAMS
jgi:hypothetical protein